MARPPRPDFLIVGAPKAGTTALHSALRLHPEVFTTTPKEPKYWLCGDAPPPHWVGPGRRALAAGVGLATPRLRRTVRARPAEHQVRGESTPFYLWSRPAHRRIAEHLPAVKLIAVVRDPIDRAYSNWMHLWSDGLERVSDFEEAFALQQERVDAGWAPFWRYRDLGLYGEQLRHLYDYVPREQVLVVRYRDLVDDPVGPWTRSARSSASSPATWTTSPATTRAASPARPGSTSWAPPSGPVPSRGQFAPPQVWREASVPLTAQLQAGDSHRPKLSPEARQRLLPHFHEDIAPALRAHRRGLLAVAVRGEPRLVPSSGPTARPSRGRRRTPRPPADPRGPPGGLHLARTRTPRSTRSPWRAPAARPGPPAAGSTPRRRRPGTGRRSSYRRGPRRRSGRAGPTGSGRTGTTARGCRPRASAPRCCRRTAAAGPAGRSGRGPARPSATAARAGGSSWQAAATDANVCWPRHRDVLVEPAAHGGEALGEPVGQVLAGLAELVAGGRPARRAVLGPGGAVPVAVLRRVLRVGEPRGRASASWGQPCAGGRLSARR